MPTLTRKDSASRIIQAAPDVIYDAYLNPDAITRWRAPAGMTCRVLSLEAKEGGLFRYSLEYTGTDHAVPGKTSAHADIAHGRFIELVPDSRITELVEFESGDPAFAGEMKVTTSLVPVPEGTEVTIACEQVPPGIRPEDHLLGLRSTLGHLAAYVE